MSGSLKYAQSGPWLIHGNNAPVRISRIIHFVLQTLGSGSFPRTDGAFSQRFMVCVVGAILDDADPQKKEWPDEISRQWVIIWVV